MIHKLYHFTGLLHLPPILKDGITKGEFPVDYYKVLQYPNLTKEKNPLSNTVWSQGSTIDKTKIRLTCNVEEKNLKNQLSYWKELKVGKQFIKDIDKYGESYNWYIYLETITPNMISLVEIKTKNNEFSEIKGNELKELLERIEHDRQRIEFVGNDVRTIDDDSTYIVFDGNKP